MKNIFLTFTFVLVFIHMFPLFAKKKYEIIEEKEFKCENLKGFSFKYPVFKGWEDIKIIKSKNENECVIPLRKIFYRYLKIPFEKSDFETTEIPNITVSKYLYSKQFNIPRKTKNNPNKVKYTYRYEKEILYSVTGVDDGFCKHLFEMIFYGKDSYVYVRLYNLNDSFGFSAKALTKIIIKTFKFDI